MKNIIIKEQSFWYVIVFSILLLAMLFPGIPFIYFLFIPFTIVSFFKSTRIAFGTLCSIIFILDSNISAALIAIFFITQTIFFRRIKFKVTSIFVILTIFLILKVLSITIAVNPIDTLYDIGVWFTLWMLFIYTSKYFNTTDGNNLIDYVSTGGVILSILYIIQVLSAGNYSDQYFRSNNLSIGNNIIGISVPDTNVVAMICLILLVWLDFQRRTSKVKLRIGRMIIKELLLAIGIILSGSRGVQVFLILWIVYKVVSNFKKMKIKWILFLPIYILIFLCILLFAENYIVGMFSQLSTVTDSGMYSNQIRIDIYKDLIINCIPQHPIIGIGARNFTDVYPLYKTVDFTPRHAHNIYLQILFEQGVIGFVSLLLLIFAVYKKIFSSFKNNKILSKKFLFSMTCFFAYGLVENVFVSSGICYLFIIVISQISNLENYEHLKIETNNTL